MNVEPENRQALGALELVTGQRDRLREAVRTLAALVDYLHQQKSPHYPRVLSVDSLPEIGLLPGDLDGDA